MGRLTSAFVRATREPGRYLDGNGLVLHVAAPTRRYFVFRYKRGNRERSMALGNADLITLAEARRLRDEARVMLARGIDPLDARQKEKVKSRPAVSFADAVDRYIAAHKAGWRGRTEEHWSGTLADHVVPVFGHKAVADVSVDDVLRCLTPLWATKTVTAKIMRSRIELVLDYARARGWRDAPNVATWRGNLRSLLPPPSRVHTARHLAALDWHEVPALFDRLRADDSMGARCLSFLILTATRSGEARGCRWDELDMEQKVWTIPASRMKAGKEHRVPLCEASLSILSALDEVRTGDLVFFGHVRGNPLRGATLKAVLRRHDHDAVTVHGFRSTFRDWAADTGRPSDLAEAALAHVVGNAVARAYQRSDLLDARRQLMDAWAAFLTRPAAEVIHIPAARSR
jgi:integrase